MPNKKITELTAAGALSGTEPIEVVQGGVNKQSTTQDIANLAAGGAGTPGGSTTEVQYNNAGAFDGITGATTNGTILSVTTATTGTNTTQAASTAFVQQEIDANGLAYTPADELTEIAGLTLETDITAADLLQALGIITYVSIHADGATPLTLTNHPNSIQPLANLSYAYAKLDTRLIRQMRLYARVATVSNSANNPRLYIQYSLTAGVSYVTLGVGTIASGDVVTLFTGAPALGVSNWITLPAEAQAEDLYWRVVQDGGDGAADPVVGNVTIQCKY